MGLGRAEVPSVSVSYAQTGNSTRANALGMRPMQERAYEERGEQYLLIKAPPASGKSRALMFIALDKLANQGVKQVIVVVPEKTIGAKGGFAMQVLANMRHFLASLESLSAIAGLPLCDKLRRASRTAGGFAGRARLKCQGGEIGRRARFRIWWSNP